LVDKDETLLYNIQTELVEINCRVPFRTLIGDIRNVPKLKLFFEKYDPEILLHAAAYKHVPLLEEHPHEAVQNNIFGTRNLLQLAKANGVKRFVMISTDKAVRPTSVMGASKAMAEKLIFEGMGDDCSMKRMAVRFGNVLGSRGSVIPLFRRQIGRGGPIKITHQDISRYFMSITEAAQLVLQAGAMGNGGEIFILKMGDPVKIRELAYRMIEHSGLIPEVDIKVEYIGLRHGEKMVEELLTEMENVQTTEHEKIYVIHHTQGEMAVTLQRVNSIEIEIFGRPNSEIRAYLKKFIPDYNPNSPVDSD
jgi:FlaA1/EpsC-like NDP-sugar epimerase